jgi:hypothetical protein
MTNWKKLLIGTGSTIALIVACAVGLFLYFASVTCGNDIHREYISPDKQLKAVVFQRNCGATTGFSTQISIIDADKNLSNGGGNIYIINGQPEKVAPDVSWPSSRKLNIHRPLNGSEYKAENEWGWFKSVEVSYNADNS